MSNVQTRLDNEIRALLLEGEPKSIDDATITQTTAATVTDTTTYPVADQDTNTEKVTIDGGSEQTVTFDITVTTAEHVKAQFNAQLTGCTTDVVGGQVVITSNTFGAGSSVAIGTGTTALTWGTPVAGTGVAIPIAANTLMSQTPGTKEWLPHTSISATDGSEKPRGIIPVDITLDTLKASAVDDQIILVSDFTFDEDQLVQQNSLDLDSVIASEDVTIRQWLIQIGMKPEKTQYLDKLENA
jgi:hypothetical protein